MNLSPEPPHPSGVREVFSVTDLNRRARFLLETHLPLIWVEGELSNVSTPSSGHWYFTLKDSQAQVRCAMFRNRNMSVTMRPEHGQQVLLRARVSLYEGRGDYQLIAEHMELAGTGALQRAYEALKQKLLNEGLFDPARKRPLPRFPRSIALITSPTGAAVQDMISVLARRYPIAAVTLLPVAVQGKEAAGQIARALALTNQLQKFDAIILGRGGGSLEDLWPFNEEIVARAIAASTTPIISAVGHEVDVTIADFVADLRAPTPTAAAELLTPDADELLGQFCSLEATLEMQLRQQLNHLKQRTQVLQHRLQHPKARLEQQMQRLDLIEQRFTHAVQQQLARARDQHQRARHRLDLQHPQFTLRRHSERLSQLAKRLPLLGVRLTQTPQRRLASAAQLLNTLNPLNTLERGYAVATHALTQQVITSANDILPGESIHIALAHGHLEAQVLDRALPPSAAPQTQPI